MRPSIAGLGISQLAVQLAHDGEVVQDVGDFGMVRPDIGLLQRQRLPQQPLSGGVVAARFRLLDSQHECTKIVGRLHHLPSIVERSYYGLPPTMNADDRLELFFSQSLDGFFFMMLDEPIRWDDSVDKESVLDYVFSHQRITKINDAMLRQYGATKEQFLGVTPAGLFAHDPGHGRDLWRRMFDAGRLHVESDERRIDGTPISIEGDYICFFDADGRITGHFGIQRDITERKRDSKRLRLLQQMDRAMLSTRSVEDTLSVALEHTRDLLPGCQP